MIEALAHDLGKASPGRFDDHARASAGMLKSASFEDVAALRLIERHHKPSHGDFNLHLLQLADRLASASRADGGSSAAFIPELDYNYLRLTEAYLVHDLNEHLLKFGDDYAAFRRFVQNCWWLELVKASTSDASNVSLREHLLLTDSIYKDKRFVSRVLDELETVDVLKRGGDKRYGLNMSLAPKHSFKEVSYKPVSDEKLRDVVIKMHSEGFEIDGIAYQVGLPQLHIREVLEGEAV